MKKSTRMNLKSYIAVFVSVFVLVMVDYANEDIRILETIADAILYNNPDESGYEIGTVERVIDGDTIMVMIKDKLYRVRLIGVDTPEVTGDYKDNPEPFGIEASAFTKERLGGKKIYLEKDSTDKDQYERLLRYVWLDEPDESQMSKKLFNAMLLENGYAKVMPIQPNTKYAMFFEGFEFEAKNEKKGLWENEN